MRKLNSLLTFSTESDRIIKVLACGHCRSKNELIPAEARALEDEYVIHYFTKGKGCYRDDRTPEYCFEDDHIVIFYPGFRHWVGPVDREDLEHYYVLFSGDLPRILLSQLEQQKAAIFPITPNQPYKERFVEMMACTTKPTPLSVHRANAMLYTLINETVSLFQSGTRGAGDTNAVETFINFVAESYRDQKFDMESFLGRIRLTRKHFNSRFKAQTGITAYQYWLSYKIAQAKLLLIGTDKTVKEIAYDLGFNDEFYFSRLFKRKERISPTAFRKSLYR